MFFRSNAPYYGMGKALLLLLLFLLARHRFIHNICICDISSAVSDYVATVLAPSQVLPSVATVLALNHVKSSIASIRSLFSSYISITLIFVKICWFWQLHQVSVQWDWIGTITSISNDAGYIPRQIGIIFTRVLVLLVMFLCLYTVHQSYYISAKVKFEWCFFFSRFDSDFIYCTFILLCIWYIVFCSTVISLSSSVQCLISSMSSSIPSCICLIAAIQSS